MAPPASNMLRILRLATEQRASDIYLAAHSPVTLRIEGRCVPANQQALPPGLPMALLQEILPADQLAALRASGELNTAYELPGTGNFRISAMRQRGAYSAVIRHIPERIPTLASLGVPAVLRELVMQQRGLVLLVGAAGAGKSTTLAAMIEHRNRQAGGHILTVEDPIEYRFRNDKAIINQREVGADTESFATALRNGLRQAPDLIMIGEIRDRGTMDAALMYAQTGHLCLATLHASNSQHALHRILSFYALETRSALLGDLAAALRAIVSQRLIPGVDGKRVLASEVLLNTNLVADLIRKGDVSGVREAMDKAMAEGSCTFEDSIARLVQAHRITREEGLAYADSATNLLWRLQNATAQPQAVLPEDGEAADNAPAFVELSVAVAASDYADPAFAPTAAAAFLDSAPGALDDAPRAAAADGPPTAK